MALIDDVKTMCDRLAALGWRNLLLDVSHGQLDISQSSTAALKIELTKPLPQIKRSHPGFEDFSRDGGQAITSGSPARSLLYHALASPNVLTNSMGNALAGFPFLREIEAVENYVFGVEPPAVAQLLQRIGGQHQQLAIVVFAYEYRPAKDTCARLQADLAFSRTGISRVGTAAMQYKPERRGFWAEVDENPFAIRVCPARFGAFLAVRQKGNPAQPMPMRFLDPGSPGNPQGDAALDFWVPVHKLFSGDECLQGLELSVEFKAFHVNEKLRRIRIALGENNPPDMFPYIFSKDIAEFASGNNLCEGLLVPMIHERLVEPAIENGEFASFQVPPNRSFFGAFELGADSDDFGEIRPAPAYIHARTEVREGGLIDLNNDSSRPNVLETVAGGGYNALLHVDFTGEGQIDVVCHALEQQNGIAEDRHPAYSLVAAPDFFSSSGQRELTEWVNSKEVPNSLQNEIWAIPPIPLSDIRFPANLQLKGNSFDPSEKTISAVVSLLGTAPTALNQVRSRDVERHSCLPDDAAGIFAPGWDVSRDRLESNGTLIDHFAAYGLGSPFPEDSKLCAALSTFWATVAPDISRGMEPNPSGRKATVAPLTDEEIGQSGSLPWDGNSGPKLVTINNQLFAECESFFHVDYVQTALENRFTLRLLSRVTAEEYERRLLTMALSYRVLGGDRNGWFLLSYLKISSGNDELQKAQIDASVILPGTAYRCDFFRINQQNPSIESPNNFRRRLMPINSRNFLFVDPVNRLVLRRRDNQPLWSKANVNL